MSALRRLARKIASPIMAKFEPPLLETASWGNAHADKTFLVIRRHEPNVGLCSFVITALAWIRFAKAHGLIPVIDMQTTRNIYQKKGERGKVNVWDCFFEQPDGYALHEIADAKRIVIANGVFPAKGFLPGFSASIGDWRNIAREYLHISQNMTNESANKKLCEALGKGKVVGVLARGTDYASLKPKDHPVQPTFNQIAAKVDEINSDIPIYLVSEDAHMISDFHNRYGTRVIDSEQQTPKYDSGYLARNCDIKHNRNHAYAYLNAIIGLSKCPIIIAGRTSGSLVANILSDGFESADFFDLGTYP